MQNRQNASASATGYLYQCRWALFSGLRACKTQPALEISIERFDDVAFESEEAPIELIQTKHHSSQGNLADTSVDLWKTIGNWAEKISQNPSSIVDMNLSIITTATASANSAASYLRPKRTNANVDAALALLEAAANTSTNQATLKYRTQFLSLEPVVRRSLVDAIRVFDRSPNIGNLRTEIENECWWAAPQEHIGVFVDYLEGWWFTSIITALSKEGGESIPVQRIRSKIDELRENFKIGSLPLMEDGSGEDLLVSSDDNRTFVRQLKLVRLSDATIANSVRDYYRCSEQKSRWARENLLLDGETERYDRDLVDRWRRYSNAKIDEHSPETSEAKIKCGRAIFHWANTASIPFRNRGELWLSAGAFQNLADQLKVGWHPEFKNEFKTE